MVIAESTLSKTWITNRIKVTALFLLSGLLSGLASGWLSSTPRLRSLLYIKGDKFLIPTYKFWTVFALVFSTALVAAYFLSRAFGWFTLSPSVARQLLALIVVVASPIFYTSRLGQIFSLGEIFLSQQSITLRSCLSQCASSQLVCVCSHSRFYKTSSFLLRL